MAGGFRSGGLWAIRGSTLFTSTDAGDSWAHGSIPVPSFVVAGLDFVLDASHAWAVTFGPGTTGDTGSASDVTRYVVSRSVDGGGTWRSNLIAGNYAGTSASIAFADGRHGYLLAAAERHSFGTSTVLRTSDGGATWSVAGSSQWLGSLLTVSDASTVWAGGEEQAGGLFAQPILAVSRDAGRTWRDVVLPNIAGTTEADCGCYLPAPPLFVDASIGYVTVVSSFGNGQSYTRVDRTTDGGRTWVEVTDRPDVDATGLAVLDANHWLMPTNNLIAMDATSDGGASWATISPAEAWGPGFAEEVGGLDATTAFALVLIPGPDTRLSALLLTTDGGRTWQQIDVE